jgi:hypothetical protein
VSVELSQFARSLSIETAFTILAIAKALKAAGKDIVELEIGDSPFDSTSSAKAAGIQAIQGNQSHCCPSPGIPEFRDAAARFVKREFGMPAGNERGPVVQLGFLGAGRKRPVVLCREEGCSELSNLAVLLEVAGVTDGNTSDS